MAKKKSSRKPVKKVRVVLDTSFDCPFCNHNRCITVSVDKRISMIGTLHCNKCNVSFETKVNVLSDPVDVYTDWIDAVEAVNDPKALNDSGSRKEIDSDSDSDLYDTDDDVETDKKSAVVDDEGESDFSEADDNSNQNLTSDEEDIEDQHVVKKRKIVIEDDEE